MTNSNIASCEKNKCLTQYSDLMIEWLECQDFILSAKAESIGMLPVNVASLRHFKAVSQDAFSVSHFKNKMIFDELAPAYGLMFKGSHAMKVAAQNVIQKIKSPLQQLPETPLANKREVLRYAQIIPSAIAAAYVGVSEHALKKWASMYKVFGKRYAGGYSYSLAELKIIAENRPWIYSEILFSKARSTAPDDEKLLDEVTIVDYDVAAAFTDLSYEEVLKHVPPNQMYNRLFRLSDLEKIRVAKLNAAA